MTPTRRFRSPGLVAANPISQVDDLGFAAERYIHGDPHHLGPAVATCLGATTKVLADPFAGVLGSSYEVRFSRSLRVIRYLWATYAAGEDFRSGALTEPRIDASIRSGEFPSLTRAALALTEPSGAKIASRMRRIRRYLSEVLVREVVHWREAATSATGGFVALQFAHLSDPSIIQGLRSAAPDAVVEIERRVTRLGSYLADRGVFAADIAEEFIDKVEPSHLTLSALANFVAGQPRDFTMVGALVDAQAEVEQIAGAAATVRVLDTNCEVSDYDAAKFSFGVQRAVGSWRTRSQYLTPIVISLTAGFQAEATTYAAKAPGHLADVANVAFRDRNPRPLNELILLDGRRVETPGVTHFSQVRTGFTLKLRTDGDADFNAAAAHHRAGETEGGLTSAVLGWTALEAIVRNSSPRRSGASPGKVITDAAGSLAAERALANHLLFRPFVLLEAIEPGARETLKKSLRTAKTQKRAQRGRCWSFLLGTMEPSHARLLETAFERAPRLAQFHLMCAEIALTDAKHRRRHVTWVREGVTTTLERLRLYRNAYVHDGVSSMYGEIRLAASVQLIVDTVFETTGAKLRAARSTGAAFDTAVGQADARLSMIDERGWTPFPQ